ncbi:MAG TPA: alkaline phosphatase family protein [Lysobacter sp.]
MPTNVYVQNNLSSALSVSTEISPSLSSEYWSDPTQAVNAPNGQQTEAYWVDRNEGITNHDVWVITSSITVGDSTVLLQVQLTGTFASSDIAVQVSVGNQNTGWQANNTALTFTGADGNTYRVTASYVADGTYNDVVYGVTLVSQNAILPQIDHVVVLMNENRSLDNLLGWIYASGSGASPSQFLPTGSTQSYGGLASNTYSNSDPNVNNGQPVYASDGTTQWTEGSNTIQEWFVPSPDPGEEFDHVTTQVFNGQSSANMSGFLTDYLTQYNGTSAEQIMQSYSTSQVPIISTLAQSFAVSDAWYASVPTQTWPNRGFVQTGSSDGHTNNDDYLPWDITTIFDVFTSQNLSWMVYNDGTLQSLTKTMFLTKYFGNETNFSGISEFQAACAQPASAPANQKLPTFSFVEPNFGVMGNDESYHPPHDIRPGEQFLATIYNAIAGSPYRDNILFIVLFDEHGGTYDHVPPPGGAQPPQPCPVATDGSGFTFDRFGVRIPAIVISSWVTPGTVFRSDTDVPLDHTSVLATLRDWLGLSSSFDSMLPSPRIAAAPNLAYVLTETTAQTWPTLPAAPASLVDIPEPDDDEPLNGVQQGILVAAAGLAAGRPYTAEETRQALARLKTHGDGRSWVMALQPKLPLK